MELPWSSFALLVVPPVALFVLALVYWLWPSGQDEGGSEAELQETEVPEE